MGKLYKLLKVDRYETGLIINALNELRTRLIREESETDLVDDLLLKILDAPYRKKTLFKEHLYEDR